ncbi:hypothetical protein [Pilimelia columellifera]
MKRTCRRTAASLSLLGILAASSAAGALAERKPRTAGPSPSPPTASSRATPPPGPGTTRSSTPGPDPTGFTDDSGIVWAPVDSVAAASRAEAITAFMTRRCPEAAAGVVFSDRTGKLTIRVRAGIPGAEQCATSARAATARWGAGGLAEGVEWTTFSLASLNRDFQTLKAVGGWAGPLTDAVTHVSRHQLAGTIEISTKNPAAVDELLAAARRTVASGVTVRFNPNGGPRLQAGTG